MYIHTFTGYICIICCWNILEGEEGLLEQLHLNTTKCSPLTVKIFCCSGLFEVQCIYVCGYAGKTTLTEAMLQVLKTLWLP